MEDSSVKLSLVITTFNRIDTVRLCLQSVTCADEILVLDSNSTDPIEALVREYGGRYINETFKGYSKQKQSAINHASHDWILLLDSDEALTADANSAIKLALSKNAKNAFEFVGFRLNRREQRFWTWQHRFARHSDMLRVFDRRKVRMNSGVHAAPTSDGGRVKNLAAIFLHYGEINIATKVEKINGFSSLIAHERKPKSDFALVLTMLLYPPIFFLRQYLLKRQFLNGAAGFIGSAIEAFYVFLKYAKLLEVKRQKNS